MKNPINSHVNKTLHMMRCGNLLGIDMQVSMTHVIYMTQAIHENDYEHNKSHYSLTGKCLVANYIILSFIMYIAGIGMLNMQSATVDNPH